MDLFILDTAQIKEFPQKLWSRDVGSWSFSARCY